MNQVVDIGKFMDRMSEIVKKFQDPKSERKLPSSTENVSEYFYLLINEKKANRGGFKQYDYGLFKDYCKILSSHQVIKKILPNETSIIENVNKMCTKSADLNAIPKRRLVSLQSHMVSIKEIYKSRNFSRELQKFIAKHPYSYGPDLFHLINTKYSADYIIDFMKLNFAKDYFAHFKSDINHSVRKNSSLLQEWTKVLLSQNYKIQEFILSLNNAEVYEDFLKHYFYNNESWKIRLNKITSDTGKQCHTLIKGLAVTEIKNIKDLNFRSNKSKLVEKILEEILNEIIIQMFYWLLNFNGLGSHNAIVSNLIKANYFSSFAESILENLYAKKEVPPDASIQTLAFSIGECFLFFVPRLLAGRMSEIISHFRDSEIVRFKSLIFELVTSYDWTEVSYFRSKKEEILSSINFKILIYRYINRLIATFTKYLIRNYDKFENTIVSDKNGSLIAHQNLVYEDLSSSGFDHIPKYIDTTIWIHLITSLIKNIKRAEVKDWNVILPVGNLDCAGRVVKIGNIVLYDSRKWDFGDTSFMDSISSIQINANERFNSKFEEIEINPGNQKLTRNSARAFIRVKASDEFQALNIAMQHLLESLNSMVFIFSEQYIKFKPQVIKYYQLVDNQTSEIPAGFERPRVQIFDIFDIDDSHIKELDNINNFLNRRLNSRVKDRLSRSLQWYRRALWDETENNRFVSYWISLEHLITGLGQLKPRRTKYGKIARSKSKPKSRPKQDYLLFYIPKLMSWRNTFAYYNISSGYVNNIITKIKGDTPTIKTLDKNIRVSQWRDGITILENLDYIQKLVTNSSINDSIIALKDYLKEKKSAIKKAVILRRKQERFRIAYLYLIRNSMFHDGIIYEEERLAEFNPIIKDILDNIIYTFMTNNFTNLAQVIRHLNRPTKLLK